MTDTVKYHNSLIHAGLSAFDTSVANSLLAQLTAVLCDGYNACTVSSITRSGSTVTVTTTGAHNYLDGQVVVVSGCTQTQYNGEFRISVALGATTTFTYTCTGTPATPATGTPVIKIAPLGWTKVFSGSNKLVIKSPNVAASDYSIRFEEPTTLSVPHNASGAPLVSPVTGCKALSVKMYEGSMLDIDTGNYVCSRYIQKSSSASSWTAQPFMVIGDDRGFWLVIPIYAAYSSTTQTYWRAFYFGDTIPMPGQVDPYRCMISGKLGFTASTDVLQGSYLPGYNVSWEGTGAISPQAHMARGLDGLSPGSTAWFYSQVMASGSGGTTYQEMGYGALPMNGPDPAAYAWPVYLFNYISVNGRGGFVQRGKVPGFFNLGFPPTPLSGYAPIAGFIAAAGDTGRTFLSIIDLNAAATLFPSYAIDITGPWGR